MAANLSHDLKTRIVDSVLEDGLSQSSTARRFAVSESTVSRLMAMIRERGSVEVPDFVPGPKPRLKEKHFEWLRQRLQESPFLSTYELTPLFNEAFPEVAVHRSTILRTLHNLGLSVKKKTALAAARFTEELRAARNAFFLNVQPTVDAKDAIFVDETGCHPGMGPRRGWAPVGMRLLGSEAAYSGGRRLSMIAAMDHRGIRRHTLVKGGVKGPDFIKFIQCVLGPSLRPGKVIVMDNLKLHKHPDVLDFLKRRRCRVVFVPPYSPDTNPIEMAFSKIKHHVLKEQATTLAELRNAFDTACATITPRDSRNYIRHANYW